MSKTSELQVKSWNRSERFMNGLNAQVCINVIYVLACFTLWVNEWHNKDVCTKCDTLHPCMFNASDGCEVGVLEAQLCNTLHPSLHMHRLSCNNENAWWKQRLPDAHDNDTMHMMKTTATQAKWGQGPPDTMFHVSHVVRRFSFLHF